MTEKSFTSSSPFPPLSPGEMRVYSMRFCPYAQRTRLVLDHKDIKYESINIDLKSKPSWFLDRNPNGTVPVLEHDGKVVYESLVTADYVDDLYPENKLTPDDPYRKARDRLIVDLFDKVIKNYYKFYSDKAGSEEAKNFLESLDKVEKVLEKRGTPFFSGTSVQMVDLMLWPHTERFDAVAKLVPASEVTSTRFPKFTAWMTNMASVPAVQKCRVDTPTHVHFIESVRLGKPDFDYGL